MLRVVLALAFSAAQTSAPARLTLELRVFDGARDVTKESRVTVYRAEDRSEPLAPVSMREHAVALDVPPGLYDVQATREQDGRVIGIRWVKRLVVMPYADEGGRHLEVINLQPGFGALQVRTPRGDAVPDAALYPSGVRDREAGLPSEGAGYVLFVVPAGSYDLAIRGPKPSWHADIEVPADRTRLWLAQRGR